MEFFESTRAGCLKYLRVVSFLGVTHRKTFKKWKGVWDGIFTKSADASQKKTHRFHLKRIDFDILGRF